MTENQRCPICGTTLEGIAPAENLDGIYYNCSTCGKFIIDNALFQDPTSGSKLDEKLKSCIYYYLTEVRKEQRKTSKGAVRILYGKPNSGDQKDSFPITVYTEELLNIFPKDFDEHLSMILVNLTNQSKQPGKSLALSYGNIWKESVNSPAFFTSGRSETKSQEVEWWTGTLLKLGYIVGLYENFEVTFDGWKKATDYSKKTSSSKTAFIAMNFDSKLQDVRTEIKRSVEAAGFIPILIDDKEHNNQIVPEILYEIRKARFLVADFTNQRNGVYYEAGYADGLGLPVIALCESQDFHDNMHFDLRQKNIILWEKPEDIYEKLVRRIIATLDLPSIRSL